MNASEDREGLSTQFKVVIPGLRDTVFRACEGMESNVEVRVFSEGGTMGAPRTARGYQHGSRISFSHGSASAGGGPSIFDWYLDVCDSSKPLSKKVISIVVKSTDGKDLAEWRILNAWPCRWVAPNMGTNQNELTVEYLTFAHEGVERKK